MYVPNHFRPPQTEDAVQLLDSLGFGVLFTSHEGTSLATSIPILVRQDSGGLVLDGHLARGNPQTEHVGTGASALFVATGPHAYISPTWYDHVNVPTWNYVTVQVSGSLSRVDDAAAVKDMLRRLVSRYEPPDRYSVDSLPGDFFERLTRGIVPFTMTVDSLTPCFKLSQNRSDGDHARIVSELESRLGPGDGELAAFMRRIRPTAGSQE
jgi:transcriptional regulator